MNWKAFRLKTLVVLVTQINKNYLQNPKKTESGLKVLHHTQKGNQKQKSDHKSEF